MLSHLFVKDLAIVSSLELGLGRGMTALTGATGAGKSVLIDALGLALGDKADASMIRSGCDRAEVVAAFDLAATPAARAWLEDRDLDEGAECLVRRVLSHGGRSRAYINARPATGAQLQELGELLVDIHGQHAHQSLLRTAGQRDLLDAYAGQTSLAVEVARRCQAYRALDERLAALTAEGNARRQRLELLRLQVEELDGLGVTGEEIEELDREQRRLANLGALQETSARVLERIYDADSSLHGGLARALGELDGLLDFDARLGETRELLEGAAIQLEEAASGLRQYLEGLELDPSLMASVEARLAQIHDLARKYRVFPQQLPETLQRLGEELSALEADDTAVGALAKERDAAREGFLAKALELSEQRLEAAGRLSEAVTGSMQALGMAGGRFEARVRRGAADGAGTHGLDRVELLVSANPGQPLLPLAKVASGGELSRISLCIQVAAAQCAGIPTLVFDEVDVGIGGAVAEIVGRLLRTLGGSRQVICVTHLPQVAAQADGHLVVRKHSRAGQTYTEIAALGEDARVAEIARMLGGTEITAKAVAHARELMERGGATGVREGEEA